MVESFFFYPDSATYSRPEQFGLRQEDVFMRAADGSRLHGWWFQSLRQPALGSVLHLHGNAANISNHLPLVAWLPHEGFHLLMLDYRGFGRSQGRPTLDGVVDDAQAALRALRQRPDADSGRLILLGQSLGGATALRLLARDAAGVRGALIDSAFASYRRIAREAASGTVLSPFLRIGLPFLPGPDADPIAALAHIAVPISYLHGTADAVIPLSHSESLFEATRGERTLLRAAGAAHLEGLSRPDIRATVLTRFRRWAA